MNNTEPLSARNRTYLQQGLDLLLALDDVTYTAAQPPYHESSIGDHLRHCLEHYTSFLGGLEAGAIDYDARPREPSLRITRVVSATTCATASNITRAF